ncbi:ankyrin repeat domain-containing protein [uncultured Aquimarina sp.]|uniref:ankyrin repeat domain-containing protein n=1 Tax=uncultured Aquimarina sp. TaxID=575652 RepID=UPI00262CDFF0|nr:ankyrin repeat domain-containing protein [uncultured Aquimarina sp.]
MKTQILNFGIYLLLLFTINSTIIAQEEASKKNNKTSILGKWEGKIIVNEERSIGILWRFEESDQGEIIGFMGPVSKGVATLPIQNIVVTDSILNFIIHSEGSYSGKITPKGITGIWNAQGRKELVLNMHRELTQKQLLQNAKNNSDKNSGKDIHESIKLGNVKAVKAFLDKGNDIDETYDKEYTLLCYAIKKDKTNTVAKYLLEKGANPNTISGDITPLMYAVAYQNYEMMKELINHNADLDYVTIEKQSALIFAIKGRDVKALNILIERGADPTKKIDSKKSAYDLAKEENIKEILEVLHLPYISPSDGPYVIENGTKRTAIWVSKGKKYTKRISNKVPQTIEHDGMKAIIWDANPTEVKKLEYNGNFKLAATSDIHGQYQVFIELLQQNNIIDQDKKWSFGNGHFVVVGDIFDRGPRVTEVLWFLYDLEKQAEQYGGKLHVLLGNHDVMVLNGNLRSVHPKYKDIAEMLDTPLDSLFTKGTVLGNWLRTRPVLMKINDMMFIHGGLHPDIVSKGLSIDTINKEFKKELVASELPKIRTELGNFLHHGNGPIYYRGYFQGELATTEQIDQLLKHFSATHIIVGHTTHKQIETRYKGKVLVIDANMKSGSSGELLLWESGEFKRGTLSGEELSITGN